MSADEVKALLAAAFSDAQIQVEGGGAKFSVQIIDDSFAGKRAVPRQQQVYAVLNEHIASGAIHAVSMSLHTPQEWAERGNG
ncbi:MAG: BolA family protein [Saccharospirillum sp.]